MWTCVLGRSIRCSVYFPLIYCFLSDQVGPTRRYSLNSEGLECDSLLTLLYLISEEVSYRNTGAVCDVNTVMYSQLSTFSGEARPAVPHLPSRGSPTWTPPRQYQVRDESKYWKWTQSPVWFPKTQTLLISPSLSSVSPEQRGDKEGHVCSRRGLLSLPDGYECCLLSTLPVLLPHCLHHPHSTQPPKVPPFRALTHLYVVPFIAANVLTHCVYIWICQSPIWHRLLLLELWLVCRQNIQPEASNHAYNIMFAIMT